MSVTSGFFSSVNNDRTYTAEQLSEMFEGLIRDGVYEAVGGQLAVSSSTALTINVASGRAHFEGIWVKNDTILPLTLENANAVLGRYDAVIIKIDKNVETRTGTIEVKKGTIASNPSYPTLERGEYITEYALAYIYVGAGATEIKQADITNMIGTASCPWVTGLIDQVDSATMLAQWGAQFTEWFDNLQDLLGEDAETKIASDILVMKEDVENLKSEDERTIQSIKTLNENYEQVKKSVSDGKTLVASAITDKGVTTANDATFQEMHDNIANIATGGFFNSSPVNLSDSEKYPQFAAIWKKLRTADFMCGMSNANASCSWDKGHGNGGASCGAGASCSCSYNNATGVLTFGGSNGYATGEEDMRFYCNCGTLFCAYKGTISG